MIQTSNEIVSYCEQFTSPDSLLLQELSNETYKSEDIPQMVCGQLVGRLLHLLVKIFKAEKILEIGTFTGYSALQMAEALPDSGRVFTCELMEKHIQTAQGWFDKSHYGSKISILKGSALNSIERLNAGFFDFVFIDADKINYPEYYEQSMVLLKTGGILVLDNMLWGGSVLNPDDEESRAIRTTAELISRDPRITHLLLPVRDGVMVCLKN